MDATTSDRGRLSSREETDQPLVEMTHLGKLDGFEVTVRDSERAALEHDGIGQAHGEELKRRASRSARCARSVRRTA